MGSDFNFLLYEFMNIINKLLRQDTIIPQLLNQDIYSYYYRNVLNFTQGYYNMLKILNYYGTN